MITLIEQLRPPIIQIVVTLERSDAPQYRHPFDLLQSVVSAFYRDALYFNMAPKHCHGWNDHNRFYLEAWK